MAEAAQTLIRARDETGPAWASAQANAAAAISGIKGMIPGLASALSAAGFINIVKGSIDAMDHLNDLSKTTGLTVEALSGLKLAAKQSGGDLDSIAASVNKLAVEMGKAPAKFRELGITAQDPLEAFKQLADIFNRIEDPQQRAALGAAALGKSWAGAAPLLSEGSKKIAEMIETGTQAAGITSEMARQSDELNDKWMLLVGSGGLLNSVVGKFLPDLIRVTDMMIAVKEATGGWIKELEKLPQLPVFGSQFVNAARLLMEAKNGGMGLGSGPAGGRAKVDRVMRGEADADVANFLGTDKEALEARKALQREIDKFNADVIALEEAQAKRSIELRMKHMDDLRDAELQAAREKMELDRAIEAHNQEREAARQAQEQRSIEARMRTLDAGKAVADSLASETEQENLAYEQRLANLQAYIDAMNVQYETAAQWREGLELAHQQRLLEIEQNKNEALRSMQMKTWQMGAGLLQSFAGKSKAAAIAVIAINKGLMIAQAIQATAVATMRAFSDLGPIAGIPAAASIKSLGALQVGIIAATGLVEAGNVGSDGASLGSPANPISTTPGYLANGPSPVSTVQSGPSTIIELHGDDSTMYSQKMVRKMMEAIAETKGGRIVLV